MPSIVRDPSRTFGGGSDGSSFSSESTITTSFRARRPEHLTVSDAPHPRLPATARGSRFLAFPVRTRLEARRHPTTSATAHDPRARPRLLGPHALRKRTSRYRRLSAHACAPKERRRSGCAGRNPDARERQDSRAGVRRAKDPCVGTGSPSRHGAEHPSSPRRRRGMAGDHSHVRRDQGSSPHAAPRRAAWAPESGMPSTARSRSHAGR